MTDIIIAGVGGQGVVLASRLLAETAMQRGLSAHTAETIGMAQRGGSVISHVRIGEGGASPMIPMGSAALIIGFEPAEAARALPYLREGGAVITSSKAVRPVSAALTGSGYDGSEALSYLRENVAQLTLLDPDEAFRCCGSTKVLNTVLIGAATSTGVLDFGIEDVEQAIRKMLPEKYVELNLKALRFGAETGGQ